MTIIKKQFKPLKSEREISGRTSKYKFFELKRAGQCLVFKLDKKSDRLGETKKLEAIKDLRRKISLSLTQWKKYNGVTWESKARREGFEVCVYRISR